jgi:hypothetical protein
VTDLFLVASRLPAAALLDVVPPGCRRAVDSAPPARADGDALVFTLPEWSPRAPARHLLPSLSVLTEAQPAFRLELSVKIGGAWSPWVAGDTIGEGAFALLAARTETLVSDIDVFVATEPVAAVRMRVRVRAADAATFARVPWLATLSASALVPDAVEGHASVARLPVPPLSQMEEAEAIRMRICSPTSVAMVLHYWGARPPVAAVAEAVFHRALDRYGVWPAAIRAAARHGVAGYLLRFPDWASAAWCLGRGLPIIASIRYAAGELTGAPIAQTDGHLVVITGCEDGSVLVNDPAAPTRAEVQCRYRLDEFRRAWLERGGVGYVFFRPPRSA